MYEIPVHALSGDPTAAWDEISKRQKCIKLKTKLPCKPPDNDKVRFVCMSDTHSLVHDFTFEVPEGDVLIHAGNFTMGGHLQEIINFNAWLGKYFLFHFILIFLYAVHFKFKVLINTVYKK